MSASDGMSSSAAGGSSSSSSSSANQPTRKAYAGRVSKLLDNFGFIDDEVFFQLSTVRGGAVKLNDQVYVVANYSEHLPFKWNALSVQVLDPNLPFPSADNNNSSGSGNGSGNSSSHMIGKMHSDSHRPDPRADPRTSSQSSVPAFYRPQSTSAADHSLADLQQQQQQQQSTLPSNTSRVPPSAAAFVSEYSQQSVHGNDSNGLHMHRSQHRVAGQQSGAMHSDFQSSASPFGGSRNSSGNSITYTSTPGSAFVSTQIQPVFSVDPSLVQPGLGYGNVAVPVVANAAVAGGGNRSSRWEPRAAAPTAAAVTASGNSQANSRKSLDSKNERPRRDRERNGERDSRVSVGKDRFGRDRNLFNDRDNNSRTSERDRDRDRDRDRRDRDRNRQLPSRLDRSTESPVSATGSLSSVLRSENVPKGDISKREILSHDIRVRYGSKIRVPSDFEAVLVNQDFEFDLQSIPKPIKYKFVGSSSSSRSSDRPRKADKEQVSSKSSSDAKSEANDAPMEEDKKTEEEKEKEAQEVKKEEIEANTCEKMEASTGEEMETTKDDGDDDAATTAITSSEPKQGTDDEKEESKVLMKSEEENEANSSKEVASAQVASLSSATAAAADAEEKKLCEKEMEKKRLKYGVKVILLSIPNMTSIFEQVFGYDYDRSTYSHNKYCYPLNKHISFMAFRNQNDGYSLLGGKFNPEIDGFLPGSGKPNLIKAAVRCVKEQSDIDLSRCSRWISLATFFYNRNETFGEESLYEYSTIFLPDVWSLLEKPEPIVESVKQPEAEEQEPQKEPQNTKEESTQGHGGEEDGDEKVLLKAETEFDSDATMEATQDHEDQTQPTVAGDVSEKKLFLSRIIDLKVTDLRVELDNRAVKMPRNVKKAELVRLLTKAVEKEIQLLQLPQVDASAASDPAAVLGHDEGNLDEPSSSSLETDVNDATSGHKRKLDTEVEEAKESKEDGEAGVCEEAAKEEPVVKKHKSEAVEDDEEESVKCKKEVTSSLAAAECTTEECSRVESVPAVIEYKGDLSFSALSLHQALNHHKHDHFELSISAELLRQAILKHFSSIIASALKQNSSQFTTAAASTSAEVSAAETDRRKKLAPTYTHLAFSYLDDRLVGHVAADDVHQLLSSTGYKISKRCWQNLLSGMDKIYYKNLIPNPTTTNDSSLCITQAAVLQDPLQGEHRINQNSNNNETSSLSAVASSSTTSTSASSSSSSCETNANAAVFVKGGIVYDIENLVHQQEKYTKAQVQLKELQEEIKEKVKLLSEFETRQKKMTSAIEKQNDEICCYKREKDSLKSKNEDLRKIIDAAFNSLNQGLKLIKEEPKC